MAVRKSKEQSFQVQQPLTLVKEKCHEALAKGGFRNVRSNDLLNSFSANYTKLTTVGTIDISLIDNGAAVSVNLKSTANTDNIFALLSSPNDKILDSFTTNFK